MNKFIFKFPSAEAANDFSVESKKKGWKTEFADINIVKLITPNKFKIILLGAIIGAIIFGLIGLLSELGYIWLPRLEPLFASPFGAVTVFFTVFGISLGVLIASLLTLEKVPMSRMEDNVHVFASGKDNKDEISTIAGRYGGKISSNNIKTQKTMQHSDMNHNELTKIRIPAWLIAVLVAAIILTATSYIWILSAAYGSGSNQENRIGYTMKNVQRFPGDTPQEMSSNLKTILNLQGGTLNVPNDPIAAAIMGPVASSRNQTIVYGAGSTQNIEDMSVQSLQTLNKSTVVVISDEEPAYAMPAAYAASYFQVPVIAVKDGKIPDKIKNALKPNTQFFVAAPPRLIPDSTLDELRNYGTVERVADEDIYKHALMWAEGRWGNFGWGFDETYENAYYNFFLTNPNNPEYAAAGISASYQGNYGPLLYTQKEDLNDLVDQFFWRNSPDYFVFPSDGPFMNARVMGGPDIVSYNAQARADLALEVHFYLAQVTGASGLALLLWAWFVIGLFGAIWALFTIPARIPDTSFYPRLYWPLAILVLGLFGLFLFWITYHKRPIGHRNHMAEFIRPPWVRAVSGTIMSFGIGMPIMIASMYLFQLFGMPLVTIFEYTPLFWLGSPRTGVMWMVMVIPALIIATLFYVGPMMADMNKKSYWMGIKKATPIVIITMLSASAGMFTEAWYLVNFKNLASAEDLWMWIVPIWIAAVLGFFTAFIANYLMVRAGWKEGGT